ncbi:MAG TPA: hypothetical protein VGG53_01820 [Mycobacterium sp.]|jgi:hypothetical protein|uniref:hypothetical protein n=1 Tax=Mycobacterium sp. TaxID=1785 RepID=UPI002F40556E
MDLPIWSSSAVVVEIASVRFECGRAVHDAVLFYRDHGQNVVRAARKANGANRFAGVAVVVGLKDDPVEVGECLVGLGGCDVVASDVLSGVAPIDRQALTVARMYYKTNSL